MAFGGFGGSAILIDEPTQGALAERPLVAKLLGLDEYKERYHAILQDMHYGYLKQETFAKRVEELKTLISEHVRQDPRPFYTYEQYEEAVPALLSFVQQSSENIQQQLDGTLPSSGDGSGSGGGMGPGGMGNMRQGDAGGMPPGDVGGIGGMPPGDGEETSGGAETTAANMLAAGSTVDDGNAVPVSQAPAGEQTPEPSQQQSRQEAPQKSSLVASQQSQQEAQLPQQSQQGAQQPSQEDADGQGALHGNASVPDTDAQTVQSNANQEQPTNRFGEFGGGMGGGMPGGRGMGPQDRSSSQDQEQGNMQELIYIGISVLLLIAACLVVTLYKRKQL